MSGHAQTIRGQAEGAMILTFTNGAEDAIGDRTIWIEMDNSVSGRPESSRVRVGQSTEADGEVQSTPSAPMPTQMPATPTPIPTAAATSTPVTQATRTPTPRATSTPRPVRTPRPRNARMLLLQGSPGRFYPRTLVIPAGSTMTWRNGDRREHTVTLGSALRSDGSPIPVSFDFHLDSRPNRRLPGVEYNDTSPTITFAEPGTYDVFCSLAPAVQATIVVR